jgi:hypothetical protein
MVDVDSPKCGAKVLRKITDQCSLSGAIGSKNRNAEACRILNALPETNDIRPPIAKRRQRARLGCLLKKDLFEVRHALVYCLPVSLTQPGNKALAPFDSEPAIRDCDGLLPELTAERLKASSVVVPERTFQNPLDQEIGELHRAGGDP